MGDPRKRKKRYSTPVHPWNKTEIDENKLLKREYGLRIRRELLIAESFLKKYKDIAKTLIANETVQGEREKEQMLTKLRKLGLLSETAGLDSVLSIELKDVLERRLQSVIFRKGLARTMKQARQFITHRHVMVGEREITVPSYLVSTEEENKLQFKEKSGLSNEEHPERYNPAEEVKAEGVKSKEETDKKAEPVVKQEKVKVKDIVLDEGADIPIEEPEEVKLEEPKAEVKKEAVAEEPKAEEEKEEVAKE